MRHRLLLLYTWLIRTALFFFPDIPIIMQFRGLLYSFGMASCGKNFQVAHDVILNSIEGLIVGNNVYFSMGNILYAHGKAIIGNNVMFGPGCLLTTGNHTFLNDSYRYGLSIEKEVRIEDGCWIAAHCVVLPGAILPARSILAAGAVLTKHLQERYEDAIYVGVPAQFEKKRI